MSLASSFLGLILVQKASKDQAEGVRWLAYLRKIYAEHVDWSGMKLGDRRVWSPPQARVVLYMPFSHTDRHVPERRARTERKAKRKKSELQEQRRPRKALRAKSKEQKSAKNAKNAKSVDRKDREEREEREEREDSGLRCSRSSRSRTSTCSALFA